MRAARHILHLSASVLVATQLALVPPHVLAAPALGPTCPTRDLSGHTLPNSGLYQCASFRTAGPRGSIYVVGDSVLLGSADGYSHPGLGSMLQQQGWGPIVLQATVGMRAWWDVVAHPHERFKRGSAAWMIDRWQAQGWKPSTIAVNVGSNEIGTCTRASVSRCRNQIEKTLAAAGPGVHVWWSKMNFTKALRTLPEYEGMLGWNLALDQAAAAHPNLVVWDWPSALATSNPRIGTDGWGIHPSSKLEYVKRSKLIARHITDFMPASHTGAAFATPTATAAGLRFVPAHRTTNADDLLWDGSIPTANTSLPITLAAAPFATGTSAAALTVEASGVAGAGSLTIAPCSVMSSYAGGRLPTIAFDKTFARTQQFVVPVGADHQVCVRSTTPASVRLSLQGSLVGGAEAPGDALAYTDGVLSPVEFAAVSGSTVDTPAPMAVSGAAVAVDVSVTSTTGDVTVSVRDCASASPSAPTVVAHAGETRRASAYVESSSGTICVTRTTTGTGLPKVEVQPIGTFGATGTTFSTVAAKRMLDTRIVVGTSGLGGWYGHIVKGQQLTTVVAPSNARVTGTLTSTAAISSGTLALSDCTATPRTITPTRPMLMASGATTVATDASGRICIASTGNAFVAFDVTGWWS